MILNSRRNFFYIEFRTLMTEVKIQEIAWSHSTFCSCIYIFEMKFVYSEKFHTEYNKEMSVRVVTFVNRFSEGSLLRRPRSLGQLLYRSN